MLYVYLYNMTKKILEGLKNIGLNDSEIKVYLYLLEHGISTPSEISRATGISRSNLHYILQGLWTKELLGRLTKGKRYVYVPKDPSTILKLLDNKRDVANNIIEDLNVLFKSSTQKPTIKFYEGSEEVKQIFEDVLKSKSKEVVGFASTKRLFEVISNDFMTYFGKEMYKRGIFLRDILTSSSKEAAKKSDDRMGIYYKYRFVNEGDGKDFPTDILVWDDFVAIIVLDPSVFATVVENKPLADTYRLQFNIMWNALTNRLQSKY